MQHEHLLCIIYKADLFLEGYMMRGLNESLQTILHTNFWPLSVENISSDWFIF